MDCQRIQRLIPEYTNGELQPSEIDEVKNHLSVCAACQKELALYTKSWQMLGDWKTIEPEAGYVSRFWTKVALEQSWYERLLQDLRNSVSGRRLAPVLVTACMLLIVGFFSLHVYQKQQMDTEFLASVNEEEIEIVQNIELAENYDIIQELDSLEDMDVIENMDILEPTVS